MLMKLSGPLFTIIIANRFGTIDFRGVHCPIPRKKTVSSTPSELAVFLFCVLHRTADRTLCGYSPIIETRAETHTGEPTMTTLIESLSPMIISLRDAYLELNAGYETALFDMN